MKITKPLLLQLLQDIDSSNQTKEEFSLKALFGRKPHIDSKPANEVHRSCQKKFSQLKFKSPASYLKLLDKLQVGCGQGLERELRKAEKLGIKDSIVLDTINRSKFEEEEPQVNTAEDIVAAKDAAEDIVAAKDIDATKVHQETPQVATLGHIFLANYFC